MKHVIIFAGILFALTGCVTKKIQLNPGAESVSEISEHSVRFLNCDLIKTHTIQNAHPNNVDLELKNVAYASGGNHYSVVEVLATRKNRPTGVVAAIYQCGEQIQEKKPELTTSDVAQLLPGAHLVKAITFAEIENATCKVLGTQFIEKTSPEGVYINLANDTYMMSGNRYQIKKIVSTFGGAPTSVYADIYRCKHQSAHY
ncbi:DUF1471 domain-containing protein [Photobacterium sanguinicancri]|uniref:DUF1471 domain-containing protein n=1 Tax=Photobacterium sanguinicancri TaxID=875932 RepID=UPI0026E1BFB5|nr:DUF1471 domain-containing protein [Photobacterium sanguinicancri]MDO6500123.1 DUF1471 domain-containing protein [Photobacterium sanguinicancri]